MKHERTIALLRQEKKRILEEAQREAEALDRTIGQLMSEEVALNDGNKVQVRPGQWRGLNSTAALQIYLNERGGEADVSKATADLLIAGVSLGKTKGRQERILKIAISNNARLFEYDEKTNLVRLLSAAPVSRSR